MYCAVYLAACTAANARFENLFGAAIYGHHGIIDYFKLVQKIQPTTLSLTTVMTPMIALFIGAVLNQEKLSMMVILGAVVLLSGLFVYFYKDLQASRKLAQKLKSQN